MTALHTDKFDEPVCTAHNMKPSEHPAGYCLTCVLCFRTMAYPDDCNQLADGSYEDVCRDCAANDTAPPLTNERPPNTRG